MNIDILSNYIVNANQLDKTLFDEYDVKRGLRHADGRGVLVGLTHVADVHAYTLDQDKPKPVAGRLTYRGVNIEDLTQTAVAERRFGFEETSFLLLFGHLPNREELEYFEELLGEKRMLDPKFMKSNILDHPSKNVINAMATSVLSLYTLDENPECNSIKNVLQQSILLIATFPTLMVYAYQAYLHYHQNESLVIHKPRPDLTTAENILYMLRPDQSYTPLEATLLDLSLIIHAEHGGGNNSTFATHLITSATTDTYSVVAAALGSLKGTRHGGASLKVLEMFNNIKENVTDWEDDRAIREYLLKIVNKEAFDRSGLIYGIGHAIYTVSDPRAVVLKQYARQLAIEKELEHEFLLHAKIEELAPEILNEVKPHQNKQMCANVDFYSGFVYSMLNIPEELFIPLFAVARIVGWTAHRMEEIVNEGKIIRPAYKSVIELLDYVSIENR
ncbi:MAG: citrate synthase [Epulopiscium sp. Nele67-Bin004]|nr:MAG: citrate synthase [Epulopiscium sp. Nele67-Bin004]